MKANRLLTKVTEKRELTIAQKLLLKMEGISEGHYLTEADLGSLVQLKKELVLKQAGSTFTFPVGTYVAILPTGKNKYSVANSNTKTTVDVLTGSATASKVKKVMQVAKEMGTLKKNQKLIGREFNQNMLAGPIGSLLREPKEECNEQHTTTRCNPKGES